MSYVSVVVPVFNGERYLRECLSSLQTQSIANNLQIILVNDGSEDDTLSIAKEFAKNFADFELIDLQSNRGLPSALNIGFSKAKHSLFSWISNDNKVSPSFYEQMIRLKNRYNVDILYSDYFVIDNQGHFCDEKNVDDLKWLPRENCFGASFIYSKQVHETIYGFNEQFFLFEDYDFIYRAYQKGFTYKAVANQGYMFRSHQNQLSKTRRLPNRYFEFRNQLIKEAYGLTTSEQALCFFSASKLSLIRRNVGWSWKFFMQGLTTNPIVFIFYVKQDLLRLLKKYLYKGATVMKLSISRRREEI